MTLSKRIFSVVFTVFCLIYTLLAMQLESGTITNPGPGFVPEVLGIVSLVLSVILTVTFFRQQLEEKKESSDKSGLLRLGLYILVCFSFLPLFRSLGALLSVWLLVFLLSKISGLKGWWRPLVLGLATSTVFYLLFAVALEVSLPHGIIDFI